jgi:hypothetical protein
MSNGHRSAHDILAKLLKSIGAAGAYCWHINGHADYKEQYHSTSWNWSVIDGFYSGKVRIAS